MTASREAAPEIVNVVVERLRARAKERRAATANWKDAQSPTVDALRVRNIASAELDEQAASLLAALQSRHATQPAADVTGPPKITVAPGAADDPERDACFRGMQLACAGMRTGAALAAHIDSLGAVVVVVARYRTHADVIMESIGRDLRKAVDDNWDIVKDQLASASYETGTA